MPATSTTSSRLPRLAAPLACVVLVAISATLSFRAALTKSATLDEPLHVASAFAAAYRHDYRLDPENPPLWKYWAAIGMAPDAIRIDPADEHWRLATSGGQGQTFATQALYQTPGVDGPAVVDGARAAMVALAVVVLAALATWTYRIAGPAAAVCAITLFALDPTFLGQAPIVKNDVAMTLLMLALVAGLGSATASLKVSNVLMIALACGAAVSVKFSGVLWPVIAAVTLVGRSLGPQPWQIMGRWTATTRGARAGAVAFVGLVIAVTAYTTIWASYGFRYGATPDPAVGPDLRAVADAAVRNERAAQLGRDPTPDELAAHPTPLSIRAVLEIDRRRLLPQAWSAGLLGVRGAMLRHQNYLLGDVKWGGWWYYFPLATVFKLPLATLAAVAFSTVAAIALRRRIDIPDRARRALGCIAVAAGLYLASSMSQDINHGVRHLLPVLPLLCVTVGIVFAALIRMYPRGATGTAGALAIALAVESFAAYPNYIAFFNAAAGGTRGGLALLSDSNLDWGQDLPQLAEWQRRNPGVKLYLCYYGAADPASYGIDYVNLRGGFFLGPPPQTVSSPGVIAMSATRSQGLYMSDELRASYARMKSWRIREILPGGTIYLFDYPNSAAAGDPAAAARP